MASKKPPIPITAADLRKKLSTLGESAIKIMSDIMNDATVDNKLKVDVCKFIISQVLDDPNVLNNNGDNLVKLAEILRTPSK
jgi:hypothetical protein